VSDAAAHSGKCPKGHTVPQNETYCGQCGAASAAPPPARSPRSETVTEAVEHPPVPSETVASRASRIDPTSHPQQSDTATEVATDPQVQTERGPLPREHIIPPPLDPDVSTSAPSGIPTKPGLSGSGPVTRGHVVLATALLALVMIGCTVALGYALTEPTIESPAYRVGYDVGYGYGIQGSGTQDQKDVLCDPDQADVDPTRSQPTPSEADDWHSGCLDGWADAQE